MYENVAKCNGREHDKMRIGMKIGRWDKMIWYDKWKSDKMWCDKMKCEWRWKMKGNSKIQKMWGELSTCEIQKPPNE